MHTYIHTNVNIYNHAAICGNMWQCGNIRQYANMRPREASGQVWSELGCPCARTRAIRGRRPLTCPVQARPCTTRGASWRARRCCAHSGTRQPQTPSGARAAAHLPPPSGSVSAIRSSTPCTGPCRRCGSGAGCAGVRGTSVWQRSAHQYCESPAPSAPRRSSPLCAHS